MRRQKICYLSGKISGLGRETYLARFAHAEEILKREGFAVINPTKFAPCRWPWLYNILGYELTLLYDRLSPHCSDVAHLMDGTEVHALTRTSASS